MLHVKETYSKGPSFYTFAQLSKNKNNYLNLIYNHV